MGNKHPHLKRCLFIAALTFAAYSNSFSSGFHFDDYSSIINNPYIKSIYNIPYLFYYNGAPLAGRPVTMATFSINYWISNVNPSGYHYINFIIHAANSFLVYTLLLFTLRGRITFSTTLKWKDPHINISFFAALMFALHPIQTQAVTYIAQRAEILSAFFYLLSLVAFIKAKNMQNLNSAPPAACYALYASSIISAVLALGSKEIAVTLPFIILAYDLFFLSNGSFRTLSKGWLMHFLLFLTLIPLCYFANLSQIISFLSADTVLPAPTSGLDTNILPISRYEYVLTQFRVIWSYIKLLILPINQNLDYNYTISKGILEPITTFLGGISIITVLVFALVLFNKNRIVSFFIVWFFLILAPTSIVGLLPDVIFEHRLYLSSLGYFVILAVSIFKVSDIIFCNKGVNGEDTSYPASTQTYT